MAERKVITVEIDGQPAANSLKQLEAQAKNLKEALRNLNPDVDADKIAAIRKQYEGVQQQIQNVQQATGLVRQATSSFGDTLASIGKAAFWLAILQFVYEWAKAFIGVTQEVAKTRKEISLLTDATGKDLDDLTTRVTAIGKTFGADYKEVIKSANSVAKAFGITQKEAFEFIEKGFIANGEAFTDKLKDLQEFPTQFDNAGMSAEKYFKVLNQEIKGGILDNKLQDTLKELELSMELTKAQQDALVAAFGQDFTNKFFKDIDTGAITTEQGLMRMVTEAQKTGLSITTLKTLTADVFKGAGEDAGGLVKVVDNMTQAFDRSLDSTNDYAKGNKAALDSAKVLAAAQNDLASVLEKQNGTFQNFANQGLAIAAKLLTVVIEKVFSVGELLYDAAKSVGELLKSFGLLNEKTDLAATLISVLSFGLDAMLIPIRLIVVIVKGVADAFTFLTNVVQTYVNSSPNLMKVFTTISEYLGKIGWAIGQVIAGFDELFRKVGMLPDKKVLDVAVNKTETETKKTEIATKKDSNALTDAEKAAQKQRQEATKKANEDAANEAKKLAEQQQKDELKAYEIREQLRIKAISDETTRQKEELTAKALKDAQEIRKLEIHELEKADLIKQVAENLKNELKAIDDKAYADKINSQNQRVGQTLEELNADKKSQANADVTNAELSKDPQKIFKAKLAQLATEREIELQNLELSEAAKNEIIAHYTQEELALKKSKLDVEKAMANQAFDLGEETLANLAEVFGKQSALGKQALQAAKVMNTGQVVMNSIVEISEIWKTTASIPVVGQLIGAIKTAAAVARAAAAVSQLSSTKFADGGLLQGNSHANGGIRGTGRFGNFEAEGGEFFVNKQATANNLGALHTLNSYGKTVQFDLVPRIKFAMGGQLPNTTPTIPSAALFQQATNFDGLTQNLNENFAMLSNQLAAYEGKKVTLVYTELEEVAATVAKIRSN